MTARDDIWFKPRLSAFATRRLLISTALTPLLIGAMSGWSAARAACSTSGSVTANQCDGSLVSMTPVTGTSTITIDSVTSGGIDVYPSGSATGPLDVTVNVIGTTNVYRTNYPAFAWETNRSDANLSVIIGSGVTLRTDQNMGAVWLRNTTSGNLSVDNAGTVIANGSGQDGITLTTHVGSVSLINSGNVTSMQARGLYVDGNYAGVDPRTASIVNSGWVSSALAGARDRLQRFGVHREFRHRREHLSARSCRLVEQWPGLGDKQRHCDRQRRFRPGVLVGDRRHHDREQRHRNRA
ncbi:MAG: hypothetical protein QM576_03545 [Rhodopseudomonas sp.]|uniref:hypothetical protein n=1 Tax=Rhodopseudomonas sp. TaxID=1078 RepID=UPI0039E642CB